MTRDNTNYQVGHDAEQVAAEYLEKRGYKVRDLNWKTRFCEIDIVAEKEDTVYFVEVKYRENEHQGGALEYITPRKLSQMSFAAEFWIQQHKWAGPCQLLGLGITGDNFELVEIT